LGRRRTAAAALADDYLEQPEEEQLEECFDVAGIWWATAMF
jgi:hypothetical protein